MPPACGSCSSQILILFSAVPAVAIEFQLIIYNVKAVFLFDFFLYLIKEVVGEFCHLPTAKADEMMMRVGQVMVI